MLDKKIKDWLKKEMVMSKVSDQIQIKTCIYNDEKLTYAFVGGLPVQYCYFVAVMLSTYTSAMIPHEDYYNIVDILHDDWEDVVDLAYFRKKHKKQMAGLLNEEEIYTKHGPRPWRRDRVKTKSILPIFALKHELKQVRHRQKKKMPNLNSLDTVGIIVQDMEDVYESSYNDPVIL